MSKHKTHAIENKSSDWKIARIKGRRVRYQNVVTAAFTPWMSEVGRSVKVEATAKTVERDADGTAMSVVYNRMTVAELFPLARSRFGMLVTTKTRKAELVRMLTNHDNKGM